MRYQLDLTLRRAEGAIARVIGTAERRGFEPVSMDGGIQSESGRTDGDRWHLRMTVEGERAPESLQQQLAKLYDCLDVQMTACA